MWSKWIRVWKRMNAGKRLGVYLAADILCIGIGLCVLALFHHVLATGEQIKVEPDEPAYIPQAVVTAEPDGGEVVPEATPRPAEGTVYAEGDFSALFERMGFARTGEIVSDENGYTSDNVRVQMGTFSRGGANFHIADIYVRNIRCFRTAFANDTFGKGQRAMPLKMADAHGAIVAVSGDYYNAREKGYVIRNGKAYRNTPFKEICVLYRDGVMETLPADADMKAAWERGIWQTWSFGPALLNADGSAKTGFDSEITGRNPRCAIGYMEPGHYCFVVVDGRVEGSHGMTLAELSQVMEAMGCKCAYNLDGGESAAMVYDGAVYSTPADGGRKISDILLITEAGN